MPIKATINERALRRTFKEHKPGPRSLAVHDIDLSTFGFRVFPNGTKTFFVRASRQFGAKNVILGAADEMTAAEARKKALAAIAAVKAETRPARCSPISSRSSCAVRDGGGRRPRGKATAI